MQDSTNAAQAANIQGASHGIGMTSTQRRCLAGATHPPSDAARSPWLHRRALPAASLAVLLALAACSTTPTTKPTAPAVPAEIPVSRLPGLANDDLQGFADAVRRQCALPRPPARWPALCAEFALLGDDASLRQWLGSRFVARELLDAGQPDGLVRMPVLVGVAHADQ